MVVVLYHIESSHAPIKLCNTRMTSTLKSNFYCQSVRVTVNYMPFDKYTQFVSFGTWVCKIIRSCVTMNESVFLGDISN